MLVFEDKCAQIYHLFKGESFFVHWHKKDLPHITCIFYLLKYVVNFVRSCLRKVLFNPIVCALALLIKLGTCAVQYYPKQMH